jgi:hypothetical protein
MTARRLQKPNQVTIKGCPSISGVANGNFPSTSKNKRKTRKHSVKGKLTQFHITTTAFHNRPQFQQPNNKKYKENLNKQFKNVTTV